MSQPRHILLVGGGHAHVAVLADWILHGLPCERATLLTPQTHLRYSGTVPSWIAGRYDRDFGLVDLAGLARRAGVRLILGKCSAIDPVADTVTMQTGERLSFDVVSIDTGGIGRARSVLGEDPRLIDIRPIDGFVERLDQVGEARRIVVIGGGAGGVELAFALRNRAGQAQPLVTLVTGKQGLLPDHSGAVRRMAANALARQGIGVILSDAGLAGDAVLLDDRAIEQVDLIVAALGSGAPDWPRRGGLACDSAGFIAVDAQQRSTSHPHVFAVGDVAVRQDRKVAHSGVHAVMAGPILAANLRAAMSGRAPMRSYHPRWTSLYLLATGDGGAIASYGPFAAQGSWLGRIKHAIDSRWLARYAALARAV